MTTTAPEHTAPARPTPEETGLARPAPGKTGPEETAPAPAPAAGRGPRRSDADSMAVWSFVLGLVGLLVFNLVLGPVALTLATLALRRKTTRRARAVLGLTLGAADLIVFAALAATDHTLSWSLAT